MKVIENILKVDVCLHILSVGFPSQKLMLIGGHDAESLGTNEVADLSRW